MSEYWIYDNHLEFCDSDTCDQGHLQHAVEYLVYEFIHDLQSSENPLLSDLGAALSEETFGPDWYACRAFIDEWAYCNGHNDVDIIEYIEKSTKSQAFELLTMSGEENDLRSMMVAKYGWIRVISTNIECPEGTKRDALADVVYDINEDLGREYNPSRQWLVEYVSEDLARTAEVFSEREVMSEGDADEIH
jgi:hypothetical protein